jgi:hypothetical protein
MTGFTRVVVIDTLIEKMLLLLDYQNPNGYLLGGARQHTDDGF